MTATAFDNRKLIDLADRPGHDIKARLLLALTALYVERKTPTDDEKRQYAELAQRLIDMVDEGTRDSVICVLRDHPTAPIELTSRAAPKALLPVVTIPAPRMPSSPRLAPMIAAPALPTPALPTPALPTPALVTPVFPALALVTPALVTPALAIPALTTDAAGAPLLAAPADRGEAFFAATTAGRREMLTLIAKEHAGESVQTTPVSTPPDCERVDAAALAGRIGELIREFERVFDIPRALCERIVNDRSGEPLVVAAMAVGIPIAVLQRMLLLVNPAVGHSVSRVYDLTNLYYETDRGAAVRLMSLWREKARRDEAAAPPAAAAPQLVADGERLPLGLRARFSELSERIGERSVTSRSDRESVVRRDLRFR